jgi:MFS family permease
MPAIARILLSALIGTIVCAGLSFLMFFLLTVFDNQTVVEAFAFGLIVGIIGAFVGLVIGSAVGIGNFGVPGGGVVGFLVTVIVAAIYVFFAASGSGRYGHFVSESRIIFIVMSLPTILTGVITALLKRLIVSPEGKPSSPRQS